jgi:hypothetical protein
MHLDKPLAKSLVIAFILVILGSFCISTGYDQLSAIPSYTAASTDVYSAQTWQLIGAGLILIGIYILIIRLIQKD